MHVAVVGLHFGACFVPLYRAHPDVERVSVVDANAVIADKVARQFGATTQDSLDRVLDDPSVDAVHLATPLPMHVEHTLLALEAGKHCACAVTMADTLDDLKAIIQASDRTHRNYMMMETGVYTREALFAQELVQSGKLGEITFLSGDYYQDLEADYPRYWRKIPPMRYATHVLGPLLMLVGRRVSRVACLGSGSLNFDGAYDPANPYPCQTAIFELENHDAAVRVDRAWYRTARAYRESFSVYGDRMGFEWAQLEHEDPVVFRLMPSGPGVRWRDVEAHRTPMPDFSDRLPAALARVRDTGHGGSHPHLVHEFVRSIIEARKPSIDARTAAHWCAAGIVAHESSLNSGEWRSVPGFA